MTSPIPTVDVAVAVIYHGNKILLVFNPQWGAYTLPMTKRRSWEDPNTTAHRRDEPWEEAAIRAIAECIHGTTMRSPDHLFDEPDYQQSDRNGQWKRYNFHVYRFELEPAQELVEGVQAEWLTPEGVLDRARRPISNTARDLVALAKGKAELAGLRFP